MPASVSSVQEPSPLGVVRSKRLSRQKKRRWKMQQQLEVFYQQILVQEPQCFLADNFCAILDRWIDLEKTIAFPANIASTDRRVQAAFRAAEEAIDGGGLFARIAHVQLLGVFDSLERLIHGERKLGQHAHQKSVKVAIDRFIELRRERQWSRDKVHELRRTAKRWKHLAGPSVFLLVVFSGMAEPLV